jgi:hypothetical protein
VLPKAYAEEQEEKAQNNRLKLSTAEDGSLPVSGIFDAVTGAVVRGALEPLARPSGQHDYRDREQRMADALLEIITHGGKHNVQLQVTSSIETLLGLTGALPHSWGSPGRSPGMGPTANSASAPPALRATSP